MSQRTISLEVEYEGEDGDETGDLHINSDAVTYLRSTEATPTRVTYGLVGAVLLTGIVVGVRSTWWAGVAATVVLGFAVFVLLPFPDQKGELGTLTRTHRFDPETTAGVQAQFETVSRELLTHAEERSGTFFQTTHTYSFVPDNIDGLTVDRNRSRSGAFTVVTGVVVAGVTLRFGPDVAVALERLLSGFVTDPSVPLVPVGLGIAVLLVGIGVASLLEEPPDRVRINFQTGSSMSFTIAPETTDELVDRFERRGFGGGGERLLSVPVDPERGWNPLSERARTHHFNVDNVALVTRTDSRPRWSLYALAVVGAVGVGGLVVQVSSAVAALAAGLLTIAVVVFGPGNPEDAVVRTVGGRYAFEGDDLSEFTDELVDNARDSQLLSDTYETPLRRVEYRYHVVTENVAALDRSRRRGGVAEFALVALFATGIGLWVARNPGGLPGPPVVAALVVVVAGVAAVGAVSAVFARLGPDAVTFSLRDGSAVPYRLAAADARAVVERFTDAADTVTADLAATGPFDRTRYLNAGAVTVVRVVERSRTLLGWIFVALCPLTVGAVVWFVVRALSGVAAASTASLWLLALTGPPPILMAGGAAVLGLIAAMSRTRQSDLARLGLVTGARLELAVDAAPGFRETVCETCGETLNVGGKDDGAVVDRAYEYAFVPDNVVSIETRDADEDAGLLAKVFIVGLVCVTIGGGILLLIRVYQLYGVPAPVLLGFLIAALVYIAAVSGLMRYFLTERTPLTVEFVDGTTRAYELPPSDADRLVKSFSRRG